MKVTNPKCLYGNCKFQLGCKEHKQIIKLQNIANDLGSLETTIIIKTIECERYKEY